MTRGWRYLSHHLSTALVICLGVALSVALYAVVSGGQGSALGHEIRLGLLAVGFVGAALLGAHLLRGNRRVERLARVNRGLADELAEHQKAGEAAQRQRREAEVVAEVARTINASLDLTVVLQRVTEAARDLCGSDTASLALRDPETGAMRYRFSTGADLPAFPTPVCEPGKGVGGQALVSGRPCRTDSYGDDPRISADYLAECRARGIVAVMAVPIHGEGEVGGVLLVDNRAPRPFTDRDEAILCRLADHAALALGNARVYEEARVRLRHTETLLAVGRAIGGTLDPVEVARRTLREAVRSLGADMGGGWVLDASSGQYRGLVGYRVPPDLLEFFRETKLPADDPAMLALSAGERLVWSADTAVGPPLGHELFRRMPAGTLLLWPIRVRGQMSAWLTIAWLDAGHAPTAEEGKLLDGITQQAAVALENARLMEAGRRLEARKDALVALSRGLAAERDLDRILSRVVRETRALTATDTALLLLLDGDRLVFGGSDGAGDEVLAIGSLSVKDSLTGAVMREARPLVLADLAEDPAWRETPMVRRFGYRAMAAVPLIIKGSPVGVLKVLHRKPRPFPDEEVEFLLALATHAALAIDNARLFDEAERRRRSAESLAEVGRVLSESLDPEEVGRRIVTSLCGLLGTASAVLYRLDSETGALVGIAVPDRASSSLGLGLVFPRGTGAVGLAVERRAPVVSANVLEDPGIVLAPDVRARLAEVEWHRAVLALPLLAQGKVIGALGVIDRPGRRFDEGEIGLARVFADQAALALDNARVFAETEQRRREAEEVARVAEALTETSDVAQVGERIVEAVGSLLGARFAVLRVKDPDGSLRAVASSASARPHFPPGHVLPPGVGLMGRVIAEGRPLRSADLLATPELVGSEDYERRTRDSGAEAAMAVPLRVKGAVVGTLAVADRGGRIFSEADTALLQTFADHAAVAMENARLMEEVRARHDRLEDLLGLVRDLSRIQAGPAILDSIARACGRLLGTDSVGIRLVEGDDLVVAGTWGDAREVMTTPRMRIGESLSGAVAAAGEPMVVSDPGHDARLIPAHREAMLRLGYTGWLGVPIKAGERVLGVLSIRTTRSEAFSPGDLAVAMAFASQAAVALENARLYQEAQRAYEELSRTQHQLTQAQKMEAVGRLAGGIAHDFNNLLTVITGRSDLALLRLPPGDGLRRDIELIGRTAGRAADLTRQLLAFSRKQVIQPRVVDLNAVLGAMTSMLGRLIGEHIELVAVPGAALGRVKADPGQIEQVIMNLAVNARDAMPDGGRLTIQTANRDLDAAAAARLGAKPGPHVMLAVADTGVGMSEETREHIFEPFFTTKEVGKGTGLGLATVYGIVTQHGGSVDVESEPRRGTTFRVYLPRVEEAAPGPPAPPEEAPRGSETILLVEDNDEVRDLARDMLEGLGYAVLVASRPSEALALAERHAETIHLVLTDVVMPEMSGRALAHRLAGIRPDASVLYMSGYTDMALGQQGVLDAATALLQKPFTPAALARAVRAALERASSR